MYLNVFDVYTYSTVVDSSIYPLKARCERWMQIKAFIIHTKDREATMPRHKRLSQERVVHLNTPATLSKRLSQDRLAHLNTPDASLSRLSQPLPVPILCQESGHVGIPNFGNTCFFSTVCQMMSVLWPVVKSNAELITGHLSSCGCINCAFNATVAELLLRRRLPVPSQARPPFPL